MPSGNLHGPMVLNEITIKTTAGAVTMLNEAVLIVNKDSGASTAVTLPANPSRGRLVRIKDGKGDAATNNITITPAAGNVDGAANYVIAENYGSVEIMYNGTQWNVVAASEASMSVAAATITTLTSTTVNATTVNGTTVNGTTLVGGVRHGTPATLAAAGSAQGNAAAITARVTFVTGADNAKGVILPTGTAGDEYFVYSTVAANGLLVYPASGQDINDGSGNAAVTIEGKTMAQFINLDGTTWAAQFTANS
jgi:hypothetical protein